jgi:toxin-antitoxin system PIN domain toxin
VILIDTNLWLYASLRETPHHSAAKAWLEATLNGDEAIALPWSVVLAVLRLSTQHRLMLHPLKPEQALDLVEGWLQHPLVEVLQPARTHWDRLRLLLQDAGTAGNLTSDAHLAALAIEHNCLLCSADSDFRRFAGLRFCNPLRAAER